MEMNKIQLFHNVLWNIINGKLLKYIEINDFLIYKRITFRIETDIYDNFNKNLDSSLTERVKGSICFIEDGLDYYNDLEVFSLYNTRFQQNLVSKDLGLILSINYGKSFSDIFDNDSKFENLLIEGVRLLIDRKNQNLINKPSLTSIPGVSISYADYSTRLGLITEHLLKEIEIILGPPILSGESYESIAKNITEFLTKTKLISQPIFKPSISLTRLLLEDDVFRKIKNEFGFSNYLVKSGIVLNTTKYINLIYEK
jgi:hypothetical protein